MTTTLEILIPTFNRADCVRKNLALLRERAGAEGVLGRIRISVSDNHSTDATADVLAAARGEWGDALTVRVQERNVGLEANAVAILEQAAAPYVMFLGDDDYLPEGYLKRVVELLDADPGVGCIAAGFSSLYPDGRVTPNRHARFGERAFPAGFRAVLKVARYGHQLSGLVLRREGLVEAYLARPDLRSIYLFIFFVGYCALRGRAWYLPRFQVLVTQGNAKDWRYDDSGLLTEIAKCYVALFPSSPLRAGVAFDRFIAFQRWRLFLPGYDKSLPHLLASPVVPRLNRILLPVEIGWRRLRGKDRARAAGQGA